MVLTNAPATTVRGVSPARIFQRTLPMRRLSVFIPLALLAGTLAGALASAAAQAPVITRLGDPSVKPDTIYKLAVKPQDHPEEGSVFLLDDGVIKVEADGRSTETFRQIVQILKPEAKDNWQEHRFSYQPGHQRLRVNWIRVLSLDGKVISSKPAQMQESDVPAAMGNPVYGNSRVIRASLSGVEVGTIVDYSYTRSEIKPYRTGDWYTTWGVSTGSTVRRSRLLVDAPATMALTLRERNLNFARVDKVAGARKTYLWATSNIERVRGEPYATDSNDIWMSVAASARSTWRDVGAWYAALAKERYTMTPAVAAKVRELVAGARTRDDTIRAVHRWVAQDIRYISLDFGIGGYQPRSVNDVLTTGFGDCKDKATIFVSAMTMLGITTYPVLLSADGGVLRGLPSKNQFDHAIAAVKTPTGYVFTDLTAELIPYGQIPGSYQGEFGLVVKPDGDVEEITFPENEIAANYSHDEADGTIDADGTLTMRMRVTVGGTQTSGLRSVFMNKYDSTAKVRFARGFAGRMVPGASGDSLVLFDGKDFAAKPEIRIRITKPRVLTRSGDTELLTLPFGPPESMANTASQVEGMPARRFPIDASRVVGRSNGITDLRITLPEGWKVRLPASVTAESPFGTYKAVYQQEGRLFSLHREMVGKVGRYPASRIGEVIAWLRAVSADDAKFVVIERSAKAGGN